MVKVGGVCVCVWGGGGGCHPGRQGPKDGELGGKLNILNAKYCCFLCSTNFKILSQIPGNFSK